MEAGYGRFWEKSWVPAPAFGALGWWQKASGLESSTYDCVESLESLVSPILIPKPVTLGAAEIRYVQLCAHLNSQPNS